MLPRCTRGWGICPQLTSPVAEGWGGKSNPIASRGCACTLRGYREGPASELRPDGECLVGFHQCTDDSNVVLMEMTGSRGTVM